ncbi:MaoC/PaaZ C-terminal domain-containing protein [Roseomonas sp. 18066]|uniref:MaoC family dehydratase n=1 Tax=Roseomonas sp. 18066 TaxID=2681412 RepID=UPI001356DFE2|nr:MaoC/PaaZ C-terminal domain-containing protein [Roseomonas sp. 18066]
MSSATGLAPGDSVEFSRALSAADIVAFAALSGDDDPVHVDAEFARSTVFGRCIAHGAHVMALVSAASSKMSRRAVAAGCAGTPVSAGYDRIRFTHPVFAGDSLVARYIVESVEEAPAKSLSRFEVTNQDGKLCLVGTHILRFA